MELWIRSQDKEDLIKVDKKVCIKDYGREFFVPIFIDDFQVASYKAKERALEILDEIHQRLIDLQAIEIEPNFYKATKRNLSCVYEMPKD